MAIVHRRKGRADPPKLSRDEETRLRLAAIVESSDDAIVSKTLDGIITSWNAAATRLFGYQPDEVVGKSILILIPPELHFEEAIILQKLRSGERIDHFETRRRRKDGSLLDVSLTISPMTDSTGRVIGSSKIARDISDRKRAEAALIQSEKLAAVGRMAAAIAHEVNNPLEAITNLAYLLAGHPSLDLEARKYAGMLLDEVGRASRITKQTLAFYRDTDKPVAVNIVELLQGVIELHRPALMKKNIHIRTLFRKNAQVHGFAGELRQVFANLLLNAIDAAPKGGLLTIKVTLSQAASNDHQEVRVSIADNGCGIPRDHLRRIFEPFFTTKAQRGTGLGLWVSSGIVNKHGGRIRVHSSTRPGRSGAIFTVALPVFVEEAQNSSAA